MRSARLDMLAYDTKGLHAEVPGGTGQQLNNPPSSRRTDTWSDIHILCRLTDDAMNRAAPKYCPPWQTFGLGQGYKDRTQLKLIEQLANAGILLATFGCIPCDLVPCAGEHAPCADSTSLSRSSSNQHLTERLDGDPNMSNTIPRGRAT